MRTVDLVIVGEPRAVRVAAADALRRGQRVLVILPSADTRVARRLRRGLGQAKSGNTSQLRIITRAEVVCADGVGAVEAVVLRQVRTGRLWAVNATEFLSFPSTLTCDHADDARPTRAAC